MPWPSCRPRRRCPIPTRKSSCASAPNRRSRARGTSATTRRWPCWVTPSRPTAANRRSRKARKRRRRCSSRKRHSPRGDFPEAITLYQKTLDIEPTHYNATLFIGDCYYRMTDVQRAGEWFARAIALSPHTETAHRYWGDALLRAGRPEEAKSRFIDALIAEPYNGAARTGLTQWGQATGVRFGRPAITPQVKVAKANDGAQITFDPGAVKESATNAMDAAWMAYARRRALWVSEEFKRRYPNEPVYRHSLAEEIDAFGQLLAFADEQDR